MIRDPRKFRAQSIGSAILVLLFCDCSNTTIEAFKSTPALVPTGVNPTPTIDSGPPAPPVSTDAGGGPRPPTPGPDAADDEEDEDGSVPTASMDAGPLLQAPCGNGLADALEQCDDGNVVSGDGCASDCSIEPLFVCSVPAGTNVIVNGDFSMGSQAFESDYILAPEDAVALEEGTCSTRPNPGQEPVLHSSFLLSGNLPWLDVDLDEDNRSLICNGAPAGLIWTQSLQLPPGVYTVGLWVRSWGVVVPPRLQVYVNGQALGAPAESADGFWQRRIIRLDVIQDGLHDFAISSLESSGGGNDFAIDRVELAPAAADECVPSSPDL